MKSEKAVAETTAQNIRTDDQTITMPNHKPYQNKFQYHCSFCACELPDDGARFNGIGACPSCDDLAHLWVNSLRRHRLNYFHNLGVKK